MLALYLAIRVSVGSGHALHSMNRSFDRRQQCRAVYLITDETGVHPFPSPLNLSHLSWDYPCHYRWHLNARFRQLACDVWALLKFVVAVVFFFALTKVVFDWLERRTGRRK